MKSKLYSSLAVLVILGLAVAFESNLFSYYNCMSQTQYDSITLEGANHVAAQCKAFILEKAMTN